MVTTLAIATNSNNYQYNKLVETRYHFIHSCLKTIISLFITYQQYPKQFIKALVPILHKRNIILVKFI